MTTEITDNDAAPPAAGRLFYDGECAFCLGWVRRMERALVQRRFTLAPLEARERRRLAGELPPKTETRRQDASAPGKMPRPAFTEMILQLPDGRELGGADAAMGIIRACYRFIARNRDCVNGSCEIRKGAKP